ncbi:MAG TPA: L-aspartate oxidase [Synechococcales cyanobacterium M55_K2018_004]|nr:L-aspartate oxidase [Synechococcales cyanobacterium M55_K2018_004]
MTGADCSTQFDVIVVGGGAAGLYAALSLPAHLKVGVLTKQTLSRSASDWAQGGLAAAIAPDDSPQFHVQDTLIAGAGLCDLEAVRFLAEQGPACVRALVAMGVAFDRSGDDLALTLEAAHSRRRVLHAADTTGRAVVTTLVAEVLRRPNIHVLSQVFVVDLWQNRQGRGVSVIVGDRLCWLQAQAIVLATGGGGQVYAQTTNPSVSTGDGVAMAWRAGALLRDLEFVQFHPTALTVPGAPRFLISEAVRGEGAHLLDDQGRRFAFDYHPDGELAPRDVVSRAIFNHLQAMQADPATGHVWLDLRPIPSDRIRLRFPNIIQVCQQWGVDVFREPIPVAPAAHYWMGGIWTDLQSQTSLPQIFAVGETTSTGVHGANRLASNSLLECIVFGAQLSQVSLLPAAHLGEPSSPLQTLSLSDSQVAHQENRLREWRQAIPVLMWQSAGICREGNQLQQAIAQVQAWRQELATLPLQQLTQVAPGQSIQVQIPEAEATLRLWGETRNLMDVALLILQSAAFRQESRGGHYRQDFPECRPEWQVHTLVQSKEWWRSPPVEAANA